MRKIGWKPGTVNVDIGGGKIDKATKYLREQGVESMVFDPFNRDAEHNRQVAERVRDEKVDTVTCNNVLNVIDSASSRANVILQAAKALKPGGTAYFSVYEGDKSGVGRQTKSDSWQNNRVTKDYVSEIERYFDDVTVKDKVIIAKSPKATAEQSVWDFDGTYSGNDVRFRVRGTPNGEESRLDERQYDEVRADNFKKWFGDWEKNYFKNAILKTENTPIESPENINDSALKGLYSDYKSNITGWRQRVLNWALGFIPSKLKTVIGDVDFTRNGLRNALAHGKGDLKLLILPHVEQMLKDGVLFNTSAENGYTYYNVAHRLKYQEEDYAARFVIREDYNGKRYYDHEFTEIKKVSELPTAQSQHNEDAGHLTHQPAAKILKDILTTKNSSKIVDANGEPLVVWHGTDNDFFTFDRGRFGENTDFNADEIVGQTAHIGFWFNRGGEEMLDMTYSKRIPVYLDIKEPVEFTSLRALSDEIAMRGGAERFVDDMRDAGHDGVVVKDEEFGGTSYVAFDPTQIKSATENNGDFSRESGDVRFRFVGERGAGRQDAADGGERMRNKEIAEAMERGGKDARSIKLATGWERGKDGKWRHEEGDGQLRVGVSDLLNGGVRRLDQVWDDPELFEAYPELREARVLVHDIGDAIASWSNSNRTLSLSNEQLRHMNEAMLRETIAHEMQHAIQSIESFAQGGSPDMMRQELLTSEQHELIEEERERLIERKSQLEREYIPIYKRNKALPGTVSSAERERLGELVRELEQIDNQIDELNKMLYPSIGYDAYHRLAGEV